MSNKQKFSQDGFTLVELAIVLMIIGLLIGGILRGQELLNNARISATIKQVTSYSGAIATFRDAYASYPGDMARALTRIPGCTGANNCVNGNGDGTIGALTLVWIGGQQAVGTENTQFWKHLALTHIISGVEPSAALPIWAKSHPASPLGGGFTVVSTTQDPNDPTGSSFAGALVLRLHEDLNNGIVDQAVAVSPSQASKIDRKMDDGMPSTGDVVTHAAGIIGGRQAECEGSGTTGYKESTEEKLCTMAFLMNR